MKKNTKNEEKKLIKQTNEDTNMVRKFFLILFGVIIVVVLLYFVTSKTLSNNQTSSESTTQSISYDTINVGNIFNRPYEEYYVLAYFFEDDDAYDYTSAVTTYTSESTSLKLYSLDLTAKVNNSHVGDKSNKSASDASEIMFNGPTLIKIKDGKIDKYYDTKESILEALK